MGSPFDKKDHTAAADEARIRIKERRPPGYMDGDKDGSGPIGDYLVWAQILRESKDRKQDVLFVTSDDKEDWWRKDKDKKSLGPRPELVDELKLICGKRLFMLPPDNLLSWAREVLGIDVSEESVQEVKRVSLPNKPEVNIQLLPAAYEKYQSFTPYEESLFNNMMDRIYNSLREYIGFRDIPNVMIAREADDTYRFRWSRRRGYASHCVSVGRGNKCRNRSY